MSSALSSELRTRFRECIEEGLSGRAAAARLKLSAATGVRWQRKWRETGAISPDVQGRPPGHGKLAAHQGLLEELVAQDGDITLPELAGALASATGVVAHAASIGRFLRKLGYTYKKSHWSRPNGCAHGSNTYGKNGCDTASPKCRRIPIGLYSLLLGTLPAAIPCQPADETSVKTNLTRLRGRSLCGKRLEMTAPFGAWGTQTFIAGLTHDSLIAPWVIKGAMPLVTLLCNALPVIDGLAFAAYIRQVLAPELLPGTVVICDNLATHRNKDAAQALKDVGCWFLYLPPYSPDLNPASRDIATQYPDGQ